jgi:hypothetical protein
MTAAEREAAKAVEDACLAVEAAQALCAQAGCDGDAVVSGLAKALAELEFVYRVVKGHA